MVIDTSLDLAVTALRRGDVIALPTEAVYGLSCDPDNETSVKHLLAIKQRSDQKGLILVSHHLSTLLPYIAPLSAQHKDMLAASWPGPITWVVPKATKTPAWLCGAYSSLAIRVTAHPLLREVCQRFAKPIVSTSANLSGFSAAKSAQEVEKAFQGQPFAPQYILEGAVGTLTKPTQIRDLLTGQILRE